MLKRISIAIVFLTMLTLGASAQDKVGHAVIGEVKKVDRAVGKVVVKTAEGTEKTFKFTGKTLGRGFKESGKGLEDGTQVVVHYTGKGVEKTAVGIEHVGKDIPKVLEGAVVETGKATRTIMLKTPAGAKETLHLTERCVVDTGKGVTKGSEYVAKEGEHITVHSTEVGGRKVAHLVKRIV